MLELKKKEIFVLSFFEILCRHFDSRLWRYHYILFRMYSLQKSFFSEKTFTTFSFKINSAWKGKVTKAQNYKTSILESRNPQKNIPEKDVPEKENFWKVWILKRTFLRRMNPEEGIPEKTGSWKCHFWKTYVLNS